MIMSRDLFCTSDITNCIILATFPIKHLMHQSYLIYKIETEDVYLLHKEQ